MTFSFSPGFSPGWWALLVPNRLNGFQDSRVTRDPRLKPGVNETRHKHKALDQRPDDT